MDTRNNNYYHILNILTETSVIAFNRILALIGLLVMLSSGLFMSIAYIFIYLANYIRHIRINFKYMNVQDGAEDYISYYTDTIQLYIEQSNIISLLQKYNDDMKHGNVYDDDDEGHDGDDEGDTDNDDDDDDDDDDEGDTDNDDDNVEDNVEEGLDDEGDGEGEGDEGECGDKNDEGVEGDDRYVFKCYHCNNHIVKDSEEHDRCITGGDCDDWFCGDCHEFCPCDEDDGDNERNNDESDEKVYINYNLPNNIVQEYIKDTEKSYDNKPSLRYRKIYKKEVFEQEEEDEEKEKE